MKNIEFNSVLECYCGNFQKYLQLSFFKKWIWLIFLCQLSSSAISQTYNAPYDIPRFQGFIGECKLQAPTSSTAATQTELINGYTSSWFYVADIDKVAFNQSGSSRRTELRYLTNWNLTQSDRSLHARINIVQQTCDQVTVLQIHDDANAGSGPNKPLLRIYKHQTKSPANHLWAAIKTDDGGQNTTHIDLGPAPGGYFNCDIRLVGGNMIIDVDGVEKVNMDVSFWTFPSYWKAGVYLQDNGEATAYFDQLYTGTGSPGNNSPSTNITSPTNGASFNAGDNVTITANATDSDGSITKVEFFQGSSKLGEDLSSPYSFTWNNVSAGNYDLTTVATDNLGATGTSAVVSISVNAPGNALPTTTITSPGNGASYNEGDNVTISANASDSDGSITKLEFFQGSTKLGEDLTSPYSFTWTNVGPGNYELTTVATDNLGATGTSDIVNISVSSVGGLTIGSIYKITAVHSGKAMEILDGSNSNNKEAVQNPYTGSDNQQWELVDGGSGLYKLKAVHSNKYLQIKDGDTQEGVEAVQRNSTSSNNQKWEIVELGNGYFRIINQNSNKSLGVDDGKLDNGAKVLQYNYSGSTSMQWDFELLSSARVDNSKEIIINNKLVVYPNPAKNMLYVDIGNQTGASLFVYNLSGKLLMNIDLDQQNGPVPLNQLNSGIYLIDIRTKENITERFKLIKN